MKIIRLLIIFGFLATGIKTTIGQSQLLAVENASWLINHTWMQPFGWGNEYWGYTIKGDTSINGNTYKKVYYFDCGINPTFPLHAGAISLYGFLRDYNQKVYAIVIGNFNGSCPLNNEYVLFDYTYQMGDTVKLCIADYPQYSTCIIDSIKQNASPYNRKTFYSYRAEFYEGIGSSIGLFENLNFLICDYDVSLANYSTNGLEGLGVISGIDNFIIPNEAVQIFPNPLTNGQNLNIKYSKELIGSSFEITNLQGSTIYNQKIDKELIEIDFKASSGLYFLIITKFNGDKYLKKILIN